MKKCFKSWKTRLCLAIVLSALSFNLWADIKISSFKYDPSGDCADRYPVLDKKGRTCALVKVKFNEGGLYADALQEKNFGKSEVGQTLVLVEQPCEVHPDEVWIYFSVETRRFRLLHSLYGNLAEGDRVKSGFFYPNNLLEGGSDYFLEIQCDRPVVQVPPVPASNIPELSEFSVGKTEKFTLTRLDGHILKSGLTYRVPVGGHNVIVTRPFCKTVKERYVSQPGQKIEINKQLNRLPFYMFGGVEMGQPSSYSDYSYGIRVGAVVRWGAYMSMMTTIGHRANGSDTQTKDFELLPVNPYSDPHYSMFSWHVGAMYRCYSPLHVYLGIGTARRDVTWKGLDGKYHANPNDHLFGCTWETGLLFNIKSVYLSAGAECLNGSFCGKAGLGIYLNMK